MKMIHTYSHPGEYYVAFMPIIDLKVNDKTRMFSTMRFIVGPAKKINADPILTFDSHYTKNCMKHNGRNQKTAN